MEQESYVNWHSCLLLRKESQIKRYEDDYSGLNNALDFPCHHLRLVTCDESKAC